MALRRIEATLSTFAMLGMLSGSAGAATTFTVDPEAGNNAFTAVFDAALGERITAVSSAIGCTLSVDETKLEGRASCSVPLTTIRVDNDDTKSDHFRQWATNKKMEPEACNFEVEVPNVKLPSTMKEKTPTPFTADGTFVLCGRHRDDGKPERITGTIAYLPPGSYGEARTLRIRAHIESFNREKYGIAPKNTAGWLARGQQLADVVGTEGTIEVSIFATSPAPAASDAK